jgi:hypothetical protein
MLILLINTVQSKLGVSITPVTKLKLIGIASPHHINHPAKTRVGTFFLEQGETPTPPFDEMGVIHPSKTILSAYNQTEYGESSVCQPHTPRYQARLTANKNKTTSNISNFTRVGT